MFTPLKISKSTLPLAMFYATVLCGGANFNNRNINSKTNKAEIYATDKTLSLGAKDVCNHMKNTSGLIGTNIAMCLFGFSRRKIVNKATVMEEVSEENTKTSILENNHQVTFYYDKNNILTKRIEDDELGRFVDKKVFDSDGTVIKHMHKDYFENQDGKGHIEYYKGDDQEYTRKTCNTYQGEEMHYTEEFNSITRPECNYKMESTYRQGKLVKIIQNGEVIFNANA